LTAQTPSALVIAAHGERGSRAANAALARLAADLGARSIAHEVSYGLIKGSPSIDAVVARLAAPQVLVYPLFLAHGYFARTRLPQLLAAAASSPAQRIRILPPLGLDPALVDVIARRIDAAVCARAIAPSEATVVMLAHGSRADDASRVATDRVVEELRTRRAYRGVRPAFLDEPPCLGAALADVRGPVIVVGLFAAEGLHGAEDAATLIAQIGRDDVTFIGNVGTWPELADLIAAAVATPTVNYKDL
jgi:sirohydrochlorin ferrochelatase